MGKHFLSCRVESISEVPLLGQLFLFAQNGRGPDRGKYYYKSIRITDGCNPGTYLGYNGVFLGAILEYYYFELFHEKYLEVARTFQRYC